MKYFLLRVTFSSLLALVIVTGAPAQTGTSETLAHVLYVETNDFHINSNSILAYRINSLDGSLSLLGNYATRGAGTQNLDVRLGPDDHDKEVILSQDKDLLFAVNGGSNTIAVFKINVDGSLSHVEGSPFSSHGSVPVSLGITGDKLFVVNANNNNVEGVPSNGEPANYTVFRVSKNGRLEHIPGSTIMLASNSNPTQIALSGDGKFVFSIEFFAVPYAGQLFPFLPARGSLLESFEVQRNGLLRRAPGGPYLPPPASRVDPSNHATGYLLGLLAHPTKPILYAGELLTNRLGVYTYDDAGVPKSVADVESLGMATCWIAIDPQATHLYTADAATNSIGVFDLTDPLLPVIIQELPLRLVESRNTLPQAVAPALFPTLNFQLSVNQTGEFLYVTNHAASRTEYTEGNVLHILQIKADGSLIEPSFSPVQLPVNGSIHPTGNAIR